MLENIALLIIIVGMGLAAVIRYAKQSAKYKERADQAEREVQDARSAKEIANRIITDVDFRNRVRNKFKRKS